MTDIVLQNQKAAENNFSLKSTFYAQLCDRFMAK